MKVRNIGKRRMAHRGKRRGFLRPLSKLLRQWKRDLAWDVGDTWHAKWGDAPPVKFTVTETTPNTMTIRPAIVL